MGRGLWIAAWLAAWHLFAAGGCARTEDDSSREVSMASTELLHNTAQPSQGTLRAVAELTVRGEGGAEELLGRIADVEVTSAGQLVVLDRFAGNLKVYDEEGGLLRVIGRRGGGPGELSDGAEQVVALAGGELVVLDLPQNRLQRYDLEGRDLGTIPLDIGRDGAPLGIAAHPDGRLIEAVRHVPGLSAILTRDDPTITLRARRGETVEPLFRLPVPAGQKPGVLRRVELLAPQPVWAVTPAGELVIGDAATYRVRVTDDRGNVRLLFSLPFEPRPVTRADELLLLDLFARYLHRHGMPESDARSVVRMSASIAPEYPAFTRVLVADDGGIWVQRTATARELVDRGLEDFTFEELGSRVWDLFTPGGRYRAEVVLPERFHLTRVRDGRLFGHAITPDGHPVVQRLRLEGAVREPAA